MASHLGHTGIDPPCTFDDPQEDEENADTLGRRDTSTMGTASAPEGFAMPAQSAANANSCYGQRSSEKTPHGSRISSRFPRSVRAEYRFTTASITLASAIVVRQ
ncbi:uncharacterized protein PHACADRAFT_192528 [Phanerochaete carnosa HHB-10118-sp]|uniref:Uncharacterized protein n=1 Tax=Phanerochaete carnosa (strain HHB-10118-sp) TaxID=650164 RepID=K5W846_PHACS|nr:uncharacterized protein PHACADRAFT_192528 [Phanerochaete carnosa HHB-10118-sp]EKM60128.1 hypothetical protein PHACADRAFT_192528 [Phanerochaete carnosa HHB-10118-sp]